MCHSVQVKNGVEVQYRREKRLFTSFCTLRSHSMNTLNSLHKAKLLQPAQLVVLFGSATGGARVSSEALPVACEYFGHIFMALCCSFACLPNKRKLHQLKLLKKTLFEVNLLFCYMQLSLCTMATIRGQREKYFVKRLKQQRMYLSGQKGALSQGFHCSEGADCSMSADFSEAIFFFFAVVKTKVIIEGVSILKPFQSLFIKCQILLSTCFAYSHEPKGEFYIRSGAT